MKLYAFGDSFTSGSDFLDLDKTWPALLSNKLKCEHINLGRTGSSNEMILDTYLSNRSKIDPEDITIIFLTYGLRYYKINNAQETRGIGPPTFGRPEVGGVTPSHDEYKNVMKLFSNTQLFSDIKTFPILLTLQNMTNKNTIIVSSDTKSILSSCNRYGVKLQEIDKFYLWPKINLYRHILLQGTAGHPSAEEQKILADLILDFINKKK